MVINNKEVSKRDLRTSLFERIKLKQLISIGVLIMVLLGGYYGVEAIFSTSYDIPTSYVRQGQFTISLNSNGTVDALNSVTLSSPRIRGLTITWLAPEGSMVEKGDEVLKFEASKQVADVAEFNSVLKIKKSAYQRAVNEYAIQDKKLLLDLKKSRRNYDEKKHEAIRVAEEAKMELEVAELNFDAKLEQLKGDVEKAKIEVERAEDKLTLSQKELSDLTIIAPIPGLVVYLEIWKGGTMSKVQEGDSPWSGQGLINLPDLSEMIVKTTVSEVDASKVDTAQLVEITLDAFPEFKYFGKVITKGTLARKKTPGSRINVFDIEVKIENSDDKLKPGMSASCDIIIARLENVISIPLEAVFEKKGKPVVFLENKKMRPVKLGRKNDMSIEILEGLNVNDEICLIDPTLDEQGLPGDRATEPEMNKRKTGKRGGGKMMKGKGNRGGK